MFRRDGVGEANMLLL